MRYFDLLFSIKKVVRFILFNYKKMWLDIKQLTRLQIIKYCEKLEKENRKQKLHKEAKDKAYTALLKDYEELKEKNKNLKEKLEKQLWEMLFDVRS